MLATTSPKRRIRTRFILVQPHHPGNVGAAARALKVMGFDDLALVEPKDPKVLRKRVCINGSSGANDVLEKTKIYPTLEEALEGFDTWCATGMPHDMHRERPDYDFRAPRSYFQELMMTMVTTKTSSSSPSADADIKVAFCFGNERYGMRPEDIAECHVVLGIPTNPEFGSLNLASAVQLIAYDWREAIGGFDLSL